MFNILLTSVGRRSYLVEYFQQALDGKGKVICANTHADTAAMAVADHAVVVPQSIDKNYIPAILALCKDQQVKLVCSLHDLDVCVLSRHVDELRQTGAIPVIPSPEWGRITLDKYECSRVLERNGFAVPWSTIFLEEASLEIAKGRLQFPVVVKERFGFGSLGLQICDTADELRGAYNAVNRQAKSPLAGIDTIAHAHQKAIIQQFVDGEEYCVIVINDLAGNYAGHMVALIESMRAGESDIAITVDAALAGDLPRRLSCITKHPGIWGVDCLQDGDVLRIIDINPRFTGDYPFQHIAGANIPAALVAWASGGQPKSEWLVPEIGVKGYKDLVPRRFKPAIR